jgi:ribosomal protein S6
MIYNLTLVLKSTLKESDRKKLIENIKDAFGKGKVTEKDWGQKPLSYPIKREVSGYYVSMIAEPEAVVSNDFEKMLFGNDDILRHLFLRTK